MFQGGTPSATLIFNSMFVVGVLYCVQLFFFNVWFLQNHVLLSFAVAFASYLVQFSWHPLLDFYGVSMGFFIKFIWNFYVISMVFLWYSMVCLKVCLWQSVVFLWSFKRMSMRFPLDSYGVSMVFLWYFYGISLGCPSYFLWTSMIFLWDYYGI